MALSGSEARWKPLHLRLSATKVTHEGAASAMSTDALCEVREWPAPWVLLYTHLAVGYRPEPGRVSIKTAGPQPIPKALYIIHYMYI